MKKILLICVSLLLFATYTHANDNYNQSREKSFVKPTINNHLTSPENWSSNNKYCPQ